jgi:hypothetical protein
VTPRIRPLAEVQIDTHLVRRLLAAQFPQWAALPLKLADSSGWDSIIYRLGTDLAVRLPRRAVGAAHWLAGNSSPPARPPKPTCTAGNAGEPDRPRRKHHPSRNCAARWPTLTPTVAARPASSSKRAAGTRRRFGPRDGNVLTWAAPADALRERWWASQTWFAAHIVLKYGEEGVAVTCACRLARTRTTWVQEG